MLAWFCWTRSSGMDGYPAHTDAPLPITFSFILSSWFERIGSVYTWRVAGVLAALGALSVWPRTCAALVALFLATKSASLHVVDWDISFANLFAIWLVLLEPLPLKLASGRGVQPSGGNLALTLFRAHVAFLYVNGWLWAQLSPGYRWRSIAGLAAAAIPAVMVLGTTAPIRAILVATQLAFTASTFRGEHALVHGLLLSTALLVPSEGREPSAQRPPTVLDAGASCALALTSVCVVVVIAQWSGPGDVLRAGAALLNDLGHLASLYRMH